MWPIRAAGVWPRGGAADTTSRGDVLAEPTRDFCDGTFHYEVLVSLRTYGPQGYPRRDRTAAPAMDASRTGASTAGAVCVW